MNHEIMQCIGIIFNFMVKKLQKENIKKNTINIFDGDIDKINSNVDDLKVDQRVKMHVESDDDFEISVLKKIGNIIPSFLEGIGPDNPDGKLITMTRLILDCVIDDKKLSIESIEEDIFPHTSKIFNDVIGRLLKECVKLPNTSHDYPATNHDCHDCQTIRLISLRYDLYTIIKENNIKMTPFQELLLNLFIGPSGSDNHLTDDTNHYLPTKRELIVFLFETIVRHFSLGIFGSAVFDVDNANDLDVVGSNANMEWLIDDLRLFFHVTKSDNNKLLTDKRLIKEFNNGYNLKKFTINFPHASDLDLHIDFLPPIFFTEMNFTTPDFWELSMIKSYTSRFSNSGLSISIREFKGLSHRNDCPDISVLIKNCLTKTLTPIGCDDEYLELTKNTNAGKNDLFFKRARFIIQRIKHVIRYYKKTKIYKINGQKMPFLNKMIRCVSKKNLIAQLLVHTPVCRNACEMIAEYYWEYDCVLCNNNHLSEVDSDDTIIMVSLPHIQSAQTDRRRKYAHAHCICEKFNFCADFLQTEKSLNGIDRDQDTINELDNIMKMCDSFFNTNKICIN